MTEANETAAQQRDRSPAFPVVPLGTALQRLVEFEAHFKRSAARSEKVGDAWKITTKAYADRIAAALRYFGLLEYQGTGKDRSVIVSEEGRKFLRAQQEATKLEIIKRAALRPKQIALFWNLWGKDRPADAACVDELVQKHSFSVAGARDFLKVYDATITFSGLSDSDKKAEPDDGDGDETSLAPKPEVGDLVQVEIGGALQLAKPARVRAVQQHEGQDWVFIEGSETGILMGQAVIVEKKVGEMPSVIPPRLAEEKRDPQPGMKEQKNSLDEGEAVLIWPENLSAESVHDLEYWLAGILKKAKRRAGIADEIPPMANMEKDARGVWKPKGQ
jgi:hypothetical protein